MKTVVKNISFYKFAFIEDPARLEGAFEENCKRLKLLGTLLIAGEGINGMLAGPIESIDEMITIIKSESCLSDIIFKETFSEIVPFKKLNVKVKEQILTLRTADLGFPFKAAPYIKPKELRALFSSGSDICLVDARNAFEIKAGSFKGAINPDTKNFSEFPEFVKKNADRLKNKKVVTYCTGGIRCEKASALLLQSGVEDVYQLEGGILEYLSQTDGDFFEGECFVFDDRLTLVKNQGPKHESMLK